MKKLTEAEIAALSPEEQLAYYKALHADTASQLVDANNQLTALQKKHDELEASSADEIGKLSEQLSQASKSVASGFLTVEVGGKQYKIIGKQHNVAGEVLTVADISKNKALLEKLVASGSGILIELAD